MIARANIQPDRAPLRLAVVFGTRPEVIKLYPVLAALAPHVASGRALVHTISTGQQRDLLPQVLRLFGFTPDDELDAMKSGGDDLASLHARMVSLVSAALRRSRPDRVIVQGDTSSAFAGALAAFYAQVPVSHVEAGLRTWDVEHPFPEEVHRRCIAACADQHFCPTEGARRNLIAEGVPEGRIHLVGNTVIDAMHIVRDRVRPPAHVPSPPPRGRRLFVTVHRRENQPLLAAEILPALQVVLHELPDLDVVFSLHPNPELRAAVQRALGGEARVHLTESLDYPETLAVIRASTIVVTDSGGLKEEATALGTPVLVLRRRSERMEAVEAGGALLAGTDAPSIVERITAVLADEALRARMAQPRAVFGDGQAAGRIASVLMDRG